MGKLWIKNILLGLIFVLVPIICVTVITALIIIIGVTTEVIAWVISSWLIYIISVLITLVICFIQRKFYFAAKSYYYPEEINNVDKTNKNKFWIERIRNEKFIKRAAAWAIYIPYFVLGLVALVFAILFSKGLYNVERTFYFVIMAPICVALIALTVSLFLYGIFGLRSLRVCKKCGAVNAFIYDEFLDFEATSGFTGASYNSTITHHGIGWGGGGYNTTKISKSGNRISCHCACCEEKSTFTEVTDKSGILQ